MHLKDLFNLNKDLSTTVDHQRCTLNDANELVNKKSNKKLAEIMPRKLIMLLWIKQNKSQV